MNAEESQFLKSIGLDSHLKNGQINIPDHCTSIKIDVGLAGDAPNSAIWLSKDPNVFVIGIEPLEYHHEHIYELGKPEGTTETFQHPSWRVVQLKHNAVLLNRKKICDIKGRFLPIKAAINDVSNFGKQKFYLNKLGETGSSTLRKTQSDKRPHLLNKIIDVNVCSLQYILNFLPPNKFHYIEHIKTDTEGLDFNVIKSMGDKIKKVVYVNSEINHLTFEEKLLFINYMNNHNFELFKYTSADFFFKNKKYLKLIEDKKKH